MYPSVTQVVFDINSQCWAPERTVQKALVGAGAYGGSGGGEGDGGGGGGEGEGGLIAISEVVAHMTHPPIVIETSDRQKKVSPAAIGTLVGAS